MNLILQEGQQGCCLTSLMSRGGSNGGEESHSESGTDLVAVQSLSHVRLFATPWTAVYQALLSSTISQSLLKFISITNHKVSKMKETENTRAEMNKMKIKQRKSIKLILSLPIVCHPHF